MDIQGYESFAIDGVQRIILNNQNLIILTEWWPAAIKRTGRDPRDTLKMLSNLGFHFHLVDEGRGVFKKVDIDSLDSYIKGNHHVDLLLSRRLLETMALS